MSKLCTSLLYNYYITLYNYCFLHYVRDVEINRLGPDFIVFHTPASCPLPRVSAESF